MGFAQSVYDWLGTRLTKEQVLGAVDSNALDEAIYQCRWMELGRYVMLGYLTAALQRCPVNFYRKGELTPGEYDAWLWNVSPNPNQPRSVFLADMLERLFVTDGEALVVPVRSGTRTSLYLADSFARNTVPGAADTFSAVVIERSDKVVPHTLSMDEVYYFDANGVDGGWRELMQKTEAMYDWVADVIFQATADRNGRKWYLRYDQPPTGTQEQLEAIKAQMKASVMPFVKSTTAVIPLFKGQSLERASLDSGRFSGMNAKDIANIRTDMFALVASCFRMPASMLSGNVNNFESVFNSFLTFSVDPVARMISEEITRKHYDHRKWSRGTRAEVDTHHIRHVDLLDTADKIEKLVGSSIESPNEIRALTGQDPIPEPWADGYQRTKNHEDAGAGVNRNEADQEPPPPASGEDGGE